MKKLTATLALSAVMGFSSAALAAEGDFVVVLKEPTAVVLDDAEKLSDRVYLVDSYSDALALAPSDNVQSIFKDEVLQIPETDFDIADETAQLSEDEVPLYPDGANDTNYSKQWYLSHIKAQSAWKKGLTGANIKVGIIDTGINPVHVDLMSKVKNSFNTTNASDTGNVTDTYGHGTMIAGILAATTNNSKCIAGITSDVDLSVIKIIENDKTKPSISNLLAGITKAIEFDCDVINMSLGWTTNDENSDSFLAIKQEIERGVEKGIIFVSSSGNMSEASETVPKFYPAAFDNVISVASLGKKAEGSTEGLPTADYNGTTILTDEPSTFSVYNDKVTCAAPGYRINSTFVSAKKSDGTYTDPLVSMATSDGTSYAAPMVASAAVIAKQLDPTINHTRFVEYLKKSVRDIYTEGYDIYTGYGALDIEALISVIEEDLLNNTPEPTASPAPVSGFGAAVEQNNNRYTVMTYFDESVEDFYIIAAAYCGGRLVGVESRAEVAGSEGKTFSITSDAAIDTIKVMAWNAGGMYPLSEYEVFKFETPSTDEPTDTEADNE